MSSIVSIHVVHKPQVSKRVATFRCLCKQAGDHRFRSGRAGQATVAAGERLHTKATWVIDVKHESSWFLYIKRSPHDSQHQEERSHFFNLQLPTKLSLGEGWRCDILQPI